MCLRAMLQANFKKIITLRLCLGLRLRQNFRYASGYFKKNM
ncbi:hypothetical protein T12_10977 [Trichinella patagoniensis]|uniref:Uncharacterized protein n=1 Tax=Trichinella patagoniensis TaxID=990121 RepID=A0A0V0YQV6_9BILA|nr:hypothetical protein T12_10977 [Trichinella patagoniensis]